jgi:RNA polymerase sigma factor (sigma-70 family)
MSKAFDAELPLDILDQARRGSASALEAIYRRYETAVYSLARRLCGDADDARDITHESFLRAFASLRQLRAADAFGPWLRRIAANQAFMHLRAGRRLISLNEDLLADQAAPDVAGATNADLERALSLLAPVPRAVLWLYHVEGYTHAEIAKASGRTASFSKSQLSRAHRKLRQLLTGTAVTSGAGSEPPHLQAMAQTYGAT